MIADPPVHTKAHRRSPWLLFVVCVLTLAISAQEEKRLTFYAAGKSFSVPVHERNNRDYVDLLEVLRPLGGTGEQQEHNKFRARIGGREAEFQRGKNKANIGGKNVDLTAPVFLERNTALVPVRALAQLLPSLLGQTVDVREAARRVLIGPVATDINADLQANPSRLVLHFSKPVNPSIASEPGRLRMSFTNDPVVAHAATQQFNDPLITSARFAEHDGTAELTVAGSAPLFAKFSDNNRTITVAAAPHASAAPPPKSAEAPAAAAQPPLQTAPVPSATQGATPAATPTPAPARPRFLVVIDPAHGGDDRGALLATGIEEKNVTMGLARRLRAALEKDGIPSVLLREGDTSISAEQRAIAANTARPAVFVSVHVGNVGRGVRTYTARLTETTLKPGSLLPWDSAQAAYLEQSRALAGSIAAELAKRQMDHAEAPAQLQPLNHLTTAAVAVELLPNKDGTASLTSEAYQVAVCTAVADGIAAARGTLEARK